MSLQLLGMDTVQNDVMPNLEQDGPRAMSRWRGRRYLSIARIRSVGYPEIPTWHSEGIEKSQETVCQEREIGLR